MGNTQSNATNELTDIKDILEEVLAELKARNKTKLSNDLLTAKQISEEYDINYTKVLEQFKDKKLPVYKGTKAARVFRNDYENYLRGA